MTEHEIRPIVKLDPLTVITLMMLFVVLVLAVWVWVDRFETGELVLTETGCQALAAHGIEPEPLPESSLCRIRAQYELSNRTERFGTIRIDGANGRIDIELQGHHIVSHTAQ